MKFDSHSPLIGIPVCARDLDGHPFHMVGEKYITAVRDGSDAVPLLIPVLEPALAVEDLLNAVDGFLFTGSPSNVAPKLYGGLAPREGVPLHSHASAEAFYALAGAADVRRAGAHLGLQSPAFAAVLDFIREPRPIAGATRRGNGE